MNAVFAADAVARLSGKIGVAAVTAGPGKFYMGLLLGQIRFYRGLGIWFFTKEVN